MSNSMEQQLATVEKFLTKRIEALESKVLGGTYTCTWDLKDNVPVSACRPTQLVSDMLAGYSADFSYCPFCGKSIEVVQ